MKNMRRLGELGFEVGLGMWMKEFLVMEEEEEGAGIARVYCAAWGVGRLACLETFGVVGVYSF